MKPSSILIALVCLFLTWMACDEPVNVTDVSGSDDHPIEYPCLYSSEDCTSLLYAKGGTFEFYSSFHIDSSSLVRGAIISVHGNTRNGNDYFDKMTSVVSGMGLRDDVMVIAPKFITEYEKNNETDWYWSTTSWKWGLESYSSPSGQTVSSFELIDSLLNRLSDKTLFPYIENIVLTGHSSGAAFTHLLSSTKESNLYNDVNIEFAVVNNQYFLHPDSIRMLQDGSFSILDNCGVYNKWPHGLDDLSPYMESIGKSIARSNFLSNRVLYFIGVNDTDSDGITSGCQYENLGINRFDKNVNYNIYMDSLHENHNHEIVQIENIGHTTNAFSSNIFTEYLNTVF